ncbi:MAG: hypothetical protein WCS37_02690 [Chloroflexota bacterium]|nr:hypothetical protein [Chloroflexota bacterium]
MTTFILLLVVAGICGFAFHLLFGRSIGSIPFYLLASLGGAVVGFTLSALLGLNLIVIGGLPVLLTASGALLFLTLVHRIRLN